MAGWRVDYCFRDTDNMVSVKDENFFLTSGNYRVSINAKVISLLAIPSKLSRCFLLDRVRIKQLKKKTPHYNPSCSKKKDSILSISGHGDSLFIFFIILFDLC